jgi:hypothetical protein
MSSQEQEVYDKIKAFVLAKYGAFNLDTLTLMFRDYARTNGQASSDDVFQLLADADIGSWVTRKFYRDAIVKKIDQNGDGLISVDEFVTAMKSAVPELNTPPPVAADPALAAKAAADKQAAAQAVADLQSKMASAKDLNMTPVQQASVGILVPAMIFLGAAGAAWWMFKRIL